MRWACTSRGTGVHEVLAHECATVWVCARRGLLEHVQKCTSVLLLVQGWGFHVLGRARRWVCTGIFALEGGGGAHRCARLSVQKACEQGASFALGRAKVLHLRVCTACRCARAECASVCSHEGFCTWILHMDFARLCVLHAGVIEAGLVLWLLCKVSVRRAHLKGRLDFAQARA